MNHFNNYRENETIDYDIWKTAEGEYIHINNMSSRHLVNCINAIETHMFSDMPYEIYKHYIPNMQNVLNERRNKNKNTIEHINVTAGSISSNKKLKEVIEKLNQLTEKLRELESKIYNNW